NLAVGAPPLSCSTRALDTFVYGNAADSSLVSTRIPSATRTILEQADGHLGRAIRLTLATYDGDWRRLVANEWFKLRAIFARYEGMDDVNWYYFVDRSPLLRFSLHYDVVLALGVLGLWLDRRHAARHRLLWYFLLAAVGGLMYGTIVGRYRLAMTAVLIVYAAVAVDWLARRIAARRWRAGGRAPPRRRPCASRTSSVATGRPPRRSSGSRQPIRPTPRSSSSSASSTGTRSASPRRASGTSRGPRAWGATRSATQDFLGREPDARVFRPDHARLSCRGWRSQRGRRTRAVPRLPQTGLIANR